MAQPLGNHENELRRDPDMRDKNAVAAYSLLPIFEARSQAWSTEYSLPTSDGTLNGCLFDWYSHADP